MRRHGNAVGTSVNSKAALNSSLGNISTVVGIGGGLCLLAAPCSAALGAGLLTASTVSELVK